MERDGGRGRESRKGCPETDIVWSFHLPHVWTGCMLSPPSNAPSSAGLLQVDRIEEEYDQSKERAEELSGGCRPEAWGNTVAYVEHFDGETKVPQVGVRAKHGTRRGTPGRAPRLPRPPYSLA